MVRWVVSEFDWANENARLEWLDEATTFAARSGRLELLEHLYDIKTTLEGCFTGFSPALMDDAAGSGNLASVQWLHGHKYQQRTAKAMDNAAANGHLSVVQWLHQNLSEGCTTEATDRASAGGHLAVVQWLHENRSEGCTTKAMDLAAEHGHLQLVKWLHENRTEGCTANAMDRAAAKGHLDVVQFLHVNRQEGCTTYAIEHAAAENHIETFRWLQQNRSEPYSPNDEEWAVCYESIYHNIFKYQALYTNHDRLGWYVDCLIADFADFETVDLLLSEAHTQGVVTTIESDFVDFL